MDALLHRYQGRVYAYANRLSPDRDMAADVVADTLIKVNRSLAKFKGRSAFGTWVHALTRNCYLDLRKKALSRVTESLDQPHVTDFGTVERQFESKAPSPHDLAEQGERSLLWARAVGKLPENQRRLVLLFHVSQLGYEEIASLTLLPIGTVKSRLHRARLALRVILAPDRFPLGIGTTQMRKTALRQEPCQAAPVSA
jgi:RNA polymerase sigma-70 factor (ECF subfamily)